MLMMMIAGVVTGTLIGIGFWSPAFEGRRWPTYEEQAAQATPETLDRLRMLYDSYARNQDATRTRECLGRLEDELLRLAKRPDGLRALIDAVCRR